ncbi:MAG: hypothetical protein JRJ65_05370 [Deltaproteobacteria bacterium]|nr:hypothetical protein [Deltaproteobacteria bacterium]
MASINRNSYILKTLKRLLDIGIGIYSIILLIVIITGGFEITLLGVSIKAHHLYTPIKFLIPLIALRLLITIKIKNLLLLSVSILFSLVVMEMAIRLWNPSIAKPEMAQLHQASPLFGWDLIPRTFGIGFMGETYHINSSGFRDTECEIEKQPATSRIMVIGDSFTFGARVNQEDAYPKQLEEALNHLNIRCEVINCGVIGHNMWQHYEILKRKVLPFHPDLIVLGLFVDDLSRSVSPREKSDEYHGINPFEDRNLLGILEHSSLWNFLRNANAIYEYKYRYRRGYSYMKTIDERKKEWGPSNPTNTNYKIMSGKAEKKKYLDFSDALKEFVKLANTEGARVLVAMIPDSVQLNEPHLQAVNLFVQQACKNYEIPFLDLTPILESEKDHRSLYLFPFDAHNSPKGLRLIGQALADQIIKLNLLSSSRPR